jgi:hypothetical protein
MSRKNMKMSSGDVVIVSGITGLVVIRDINFNVPNGELTSIPGEIAYRSRELWDYISCGQVFWHNRPNNNHQVVPKPKPTPVIVTPPVSPPTSNTPLQSELPEVQDEATKVKFDLLEKVKRLEAENALLKAEGEKKSTNEETLKTILERLDNLSTTTVQVVPQAQGSTSSTPESNTEEKVPIYLPSLPDARSFPSRIIPKVTKSDGVEAEKSSKALRQLRKKGG